MTIGSAAAISPLNKGTAAPSETEKIRKAASGFEALFVAQLLKSARESSASGEESQSGSAMMEVAEEQIAQAISDRSGLGLAQSVVESLGKLNVVSPPATQKIPGSGQGATGFELKARP